MTASQSWTVLEMLRYSTSYLEGKGVSEPRLSVEHLLAAVLGLKRLELYLQFDRPLLPEEIAGFKERLLRRARGEPLQYIVGHTDFRHLRLRVDRRVLIPRPETELLVGEVLAWAAGRSGLDVLDLGTGSGAIALSLAAEGDFARVVATDLSADALSVAALNLESAAPRSPVELRQGSLFAPVTGERFDIVVSNPPYIGEVERDQVDAEVRDWEPEGALFSGADGLEVIGPLVAAAPGHLRPGGLLAMEIGASQAEAVADRVRQTGAFSEPRVLPDLTGRQRMILAGLR
jgi:release factor glutamine methyltransferase